MKARAVPKIVTCERIGEVVFMQLLSGILANWICTAERRAGLRLQFCV
jgi:hypothetical protein